MGIVSLKQQTERVEIGSFETENKIVFRFFDRLPSSERDDALLKAINIGVLALMEDRLSAFLAKTSNELGTELESLKLIFDMKQEVFLKTAMKGVAAEEDIAEFLGAFFIERGLKDELHLTGSSAGKIHKNKTGDLVSNIDGKDDLKIVIESKFDKALSLGDIQDKDVFKNKSDTAWSQLIEAQANREGKSSIIVFDISSVSAGILKNVHDIKYIPQIGFVVIVDSQKGDYSNLGIAYMLSRDIALKSHSLNINKEFLEIFVGRIIKDVFDIRQIEKLVKNNIDNNKNILAHLDKGLLSLEFTYSYLCKFLEDGELSKEDLLSFYFGDEVRNQFKDLEKDIKAL